MLVISHAVSSSNDCKLGYNNTAVGITLQSPKAKADDDKNHMFYVISLIHSLCVDVVQQTDDQTWSNQHIGVI